MIIFKIYIINIFFNYYWFITYKNGWFLLKSLCFWIFKYYIHRITIGVLFYIINKFIVGLTVNGDLDLKMTTGA